MKKISLLIVAFMMSVGMVMAQAPQRGERKQMDPKARAEKMTERMTSEYGLDDSQKAKLLTLNTEVASKMKDRAPGKKQRAAKLKKAETTQTDAQKAEKAEARKAEREKRMAAMKESRQAYDSKIKEIFTAEQYTKYQAKQAERQQQAKERGKDGRRDRHERRTRA